MSGQNGEIATPSDGLKKTEAWSKNNDGSELALQNSAKLVWPAAMFQAPEEHHNASGKHLFTDRGSRVTFDKVLVTDDDIRLALAHSQQKFGDKVILTGDDIVFSQRMARLADDMGLTVLNTELQPAISEHRAALARFAPNVVPAMAVKRNWWKRIFYTLQKGK